MAASRFNRRYATRSVARPFRGLKPTAKFIQSLCDVNPTGFFAALPVDVRKALPSLRALPVDVRKSYAFLTGLNQIPRLRRRSLIAIEERQPSREALSRSHGKAQLFRTSNGIAEDRIAGKTLSQKLYRLALVSP